MARRGTVVATIAHISLSCAIVLGLTLGIGCRWETNDDVAMSMVAHGYGLAAHAAPTLIFSNVLWGHIVQSIPTIGGVLGYSTATLAVITTVWAVLMIGLRRLGWGWPVSLAAAGLCMVRPTLIPQFTLNAGFLTAAAVLCWSDHGETKRTWAFALGCVLFIVATLIRSQEAYLVLLVAAPLLPWRLVLRDRAAQAATLVTITLIGLAVGIDLQAYQGTEWRSFNEFNLPRAAFTDFGAGKFLVGHSDILTRHNVTFNDINLIENWFFADPALTSAGLLKSILNDIGPLPEIYGTFLQGLNGILGPLRPVVFPTFAIALINFWFYPSRTVAASWIIAIFFLFLIGYLGRPAIDRVTLPVVGLLALAPLLRPPHLHRKRAWSALLVMGAAISIGMTVDDALTTRRADEWSRRSFIGFPEEPVVIWGASLPFEALYPVLDGTGTARRFRLFSLGTFTLAPFSLAQEEFKAGRSIPDLIRSEASIPLCATPRFLEYFRTYCSEHYSGEVRATDQRTFGDVTINWTRCSLLEQH